MFVWKNSALGNFDYLKSSHVEIALNMIPHTIKLKIHSYQHKHNMLSKTTPYSPEILSRVPNMTREERINGSRSDREIYFILKQRQLEDTYNRCLRPCTWCFEPTGNFCDGTICKKRNKKFGQNMAAVCNDCEPEKTMCRDCVRKGATVHNWASEFLANNQNTDSAMMQIL